jgi:dGTPase
MFQRVYLGPEVTQERAKIRRAIRTLFEHFSASPEQIPDSLPDGPRHRRVTDYIAGMTDRFCVAQYEALTVPTAFSL